MLLKVSIALFLFIAFQSVLGTDPNELRETAQEKQLNQQKRRLSLQNTAEIQHCLVNAGDVGCGMFECFNNNSCEIRGLNEICMTFLHNAGKFDSQGKSFIKDALRCMAHGVRGRFSCVSRRCVAVEDMVFQLQRDCYLRHNLCLAARDNVHVMVDMVHFHHLFPKGPHVELVNILLGCGDAVRAAIARRVQAQCEQNWGALCQSLSLCSLGQSDQPLGQSDQPLGQSDQPLSQSDQPLSQSDQPLSDYTQRPVTALPSTLQGRNTLPPGVQFRLSLPEPDPHGPDQDQDQGGQPRMVQAQPKPQGLSQNQNQDQGQDHATDLVLSGPNSATQG